jgi:hypothetical protein
VLLAATFRVYLARVAHASERDTTILEVAAVLEREGLDAEDLRILQDEVDALEHPPGLFRRLTDRARNIAGVQWKHLMGELQESREAMALIAQRVQGGQLNEEDADKIRSQLMDLVKVFPAGLIAAANSAFPVPGTSVLTPWILARLGLMPSRWREAHLMDQLIKEQQRLRAAGRNDLADRLAELRSRLEAEAAERDNIGKSARVLTHWDANENGVWDPEERAKYLEELDRLRGLAHRHRARKRWFLEHEGEVFGPARLSEIEGEPGTDELLVCYEDQTGWVALPDVFGREPVFD